MLWSKASTPCAKSWHPCSPKPVNWGIWALTPCRAAPHSRMPTCAATNVSSKPFTESCTPLISTCFPRTADGAGVQNGSNAYKSSILRPFLSSPISFSKASGEHPKTGKKKGGIKVHANIHANEFVPSDIRFTSAAKGESFMLRPSNYHSGDILAFDRAYIDYTKFEEMMEAGVTYVTKMKKNLQYETLET